MKKLVLAGFAGTALALLLWVPARSTIGSAADAAATFKSKCAACHAPDGSGGTPLGRKENLRDLRSAEVQSQTDDQLYNVIAKGKGKMPAYEKSLSADGCKELVALIRSWKR
jgi:mono/diheme cytochrome c family protein